MSTFLDKIEHCSTKQNSLLCIGLDTDIDLIPVSLKGKDTQFYFNKAIIDATHDIVCAYKPNSAYYEAQGRDGIDQLKKTCDYIKETYPEIPIILDAKRGDIASTNNGYAAFAFDYLQVDAITLNPYLGKFANEPFLSRKDKGCIFLCRTSNPGADEFQNLMVKDEALYMVIGKKIMTEWNEFNNCLLVIGATVPDELHTMRKTLPHATFLVPGIGKQGGDLEQTISLGKNNEGKGIIITASRSIIYTSKELDFAEKARESALSLNQQIQQIRS